jgi:hypothetical protein
MATKKISELPLVNRVSGSQVAGGSVLPIVIGGGIQGTTNQISVEDFSLFVNAYNATTSSNTFIGTQNVTGDVNISGRLTVREVVAQYETASILFSTGSTKLGDQLTDKHEFTGSTNITGSISVNGNSLLNGVSLNNSFDRLHQATQSLELFTSSQAARNLVLSTVTGSINQATASIQFQTASLLQFTASQDSRNFTLSQVTGSFNYFYQATASLQTFTASQADRNLVLSIVTGSINQATASLQTFTASQADRNLVLSIVTGSINQATASIQFQTASLLTFTASQDSRNFTLSQVTGSFRGEIGGLEDYSASLKAAAIVSSSTQVQNYDIFGLNSNLYRATGSLIGITNGLMAFTAALDNTYATDAQLYQLYQSTRSLELHSGSMIGVTNGLMAYTASNSTLNTGLRGEVNGIEAYTASLKGQAIVSSSTQIQNYDVFALNSNLFTSTGSLIGITNGLMAFTAALDSTYATDAQLFQLYQATRSLELHSGSMVGITNGIMALTASMKGQAIVSSSTQIQNYDVFALNSNLYNGTGSIKGEVAGIEAYTASLKAAAIVSSSQQITNYYKFAETASANTFYGNQKIKGNLDIDNKVSVTGSLIVSSSLNQLWATPEFQLYNGLGTVNFALTPNTGNQLQIQAYGTKAEITQPNEPLRLLTPTLQIVKYDNTPTKVEVSGSLNVTGSIFISGSVYANTTSQSVASNTASLDFTAANFFMVQLGSNVTTHISASNLRAGQSVNVLVTTGTNSTASFSTNVRQPSGSFYLPTSGSGKKDILSFVSFDSSNLYLVAVNQMI